MIGKNEYHVIWHIEVSADSPEEAAQVAKAIQADPGSTATHFEVVDEDAVLHHVDTGFLGEME